MGRFATTPYHRLGRVTAGITLCISIVLLVFLVTAGWEFLLEGFFEQGASGNDAEESTAEHWEYVITATFAAAISVSVLSLVSLRTVDRLQARVEERTRALEKSNENLNREITDRKQLDEKFHTAFESVTVGSVVIGETGHIESFNLAAQEIFGYSADEVIGQNVKILMPEPYVSEHDGYIQNYLETGDRKIIGIGREVTGLRKNGEVFPMHLGVGAMLVGDSKSFIGSITDLTELKAMEHQLLQAQRMEAVGQLTGGVAHDFNNLLAIMIGNAQFLEDRAGEDEESKAFIGEIKAAVDRASSLTGRLLAFSRQATLAPVSSDVSGLIGGLHDMLQRSLGETVDLKVAPASDLWPATIDPHQFENALVNLALNARDAMPSGGTLTIETAGPPPLSWSTVIVRKRRIRDGEQATQTGRDCHQVAAG